MAESDPVGVRAGIVRALELDLVGPGPDDSLATEILPQAPSRWYLTGFLAPVGASAEARTDETANEELELEDEAGGADDAITPDPPAAKRPRFPSSMGLSFLVPPETGRVTAPPGWGAYPRGP